MSTILEGNARGGRGGFVPTAAAVAVGSGVIAIGAGFVWSAGVSGSVTSQVLGVTVATSTLLALVASYVVVLCGIFVIFLAFVDALFGSVLGQPSTAGWREVAEYVGVRAVCVVLGFGVLWGLSVAVPVGEPDTGTTIPTDRVGHCETDRTPQPVTARSGSYGVLQECQVPGWVSGENGGTR